MALVQFVNCDDPGFRNWFLKKSLNEYQQALDAIDAQLQDNIKAKENKLATDKRAVEQRLGHAKHALDDIKAETWATDKVMQQAQEGSACRSVLSELYQTQLTTQSAKSVEVCNLETQLRDLESGAHRAIRRLRTAAQGKKDELGAPPPTTAGSVVISE